MMRGWDSPPPSLRFQRHSQPPDIRRGSFAKLIARLPWLVELEHDRNKARSRRKPVTFGDLIREGKLLEVHCSNCRPERHLYIDARSLSLSRRMPVPEIARHLVCSKCGTRNSGLSAHQAPAQSFPPMSNDPTLKPIESAYW
jgi:hypothetical protein